jgi:hypothetical protein
MREARVGKLFVMLFTIGDLPTNPMCLRECLVGGEVFSRIDSLAHAESLCTPSPEQPLARVGVANIESTRREAPKGALEPWLNVRIARANSLGGYLSNT